MCSLKGTVWGSRQFLQLTQSLLVFAARSCGDLSSWHWNPGLGGGVPGVGLGLLALMISLLNFYPPHVDVGPAYSMSPPPPTSLDRCSFFNSVVVRLPFNSTSVGSE